jgi:hypothetical protein
MDFNSLMAKMRELDQPTPTAPVVEAPVEECGDPMMGGMPPSMADKPSTPPPSMSVNINAQGLDDISELMKLLTKVNPDMINQPAAPEISVMPSLTPPGPSISSIGDLGDLDKGPLKMLPDLDKDGPMDMPGADAMNKPDGGHSEPDADNMGGPSDHDADNKPEIKGLDRDGDGDHDMDDHDMEKKDDNDKPDDKEEKEEGFQDATTQPNEQYKDVDYMVNKLAGGMNKPKQSFSGKPYRGDNPMAAGAYESKDALRASIRAELQQRLAEAKGAK